MTTNPSAMTTNSSAMSSSSTGSCIILGWNTTIPWDNPYNLISLDTQAVIDRVKSAILIPLLYLVGAPANIINMTVFFKQGLRERINFCLFALAMADLVFLTYLLVLYSERIYTQFTNGEKYGQGLKYMVNNNIIGLYGFGYVPTLLTAVISTERCVCVLFPLQAQRCIPTRVLAWAILIGGCLLGFMRFAVTGQYYVACFYEERTRRTSWQILVTDYYLRNKMLRGLDAFYGFCVAMGGPIIVLITTIITTAKLQQTIRWRHLTSSSLSSKEIGVTKMLICLSIEFFILSIPIITLRVVPVFVPQLSASGHYSNAFFTALSFAELSNYISSTVNFFVYYFTGSKYRETLSALFARKPSTQGKGTPRLQETNQQSTH